jgi:hypothetical protein
MQGGRRGINTDEGGSRASRYSGCMMLLLPLLLVTTLIAIAGVGVVYKLSPENENRFALWIFVPIIAGVLCWLLYRPYMMIVYSVVIGSEGRR